MLKLVRVLMSQKLLMNLLVFLVFIIGYRTLIHLNRESFPEVNFDMVSITTIYPGGSPDEMEQLVSIPIEKKLREVDGLDKVRSYNIENVSVIAIYLEDRIKNKKAVIQDIKDKVEAVTNLPEKAEKPVVEEIKLDKTEVIYAAIYSKDNNKATYKELRQVADELEDYIYDIDGVAEVQPFGFL
ncbi:MAG: efflux RND transporter permease subunit, partial [Leptospiraceae bacterium]|nr:efflux RND transporter permease subunit [Leptospiraceae bacterium]